MLLLSDVIRGYTESIILAQLRKKDSYGYEINKVIQKATGGAFELKEATLYTAFRRLEAGGYIFSYWGEENVGARRRYYSMTEEGHRLYEENYADWIRAREMIDILLQ